MADLIVPIMQELQTLNLARQCFPMWTEWGVSDESSTVHSLGLSYLLTLGQSLGFVACAEYPVDGPHIRADCVWWEPDTKRIAAIFEFERHKDGPELIEKTRNLMRAWHVAQSKPLIGLIFWTQKFFPDGAKVATPLWKKLEEGFSDKNRSQVGPVPAKHFLLAECLHIENPAGTWQLKGFQPWSRK